MITWREYVKDVPISDIPIAVQHNIEELLKRVNVIREKYGQPMIVTSGLRSEYVHKEIYRKINMRRKKLGLPEVRVPMQSSHLIGKAIDIFDGSGKLQAWCLENVAVLEEVELWMEDFSATVGWCHFQSVPPKSGKRFFLP